MSELKKVCRKCKEAKPLTEEFYPHNRRSKDTFDDRCKACWKVIQAEKRARGVDHTARAQRHAVEEAKNKRGWRDVTLPGARGAGKSTAAQQAVQEPAKVPAKSVRHPGPETAPGVTVVSPARLADLPPRGVQLRGYQGGSLAEHAGAFRARYGLKPGARVRAHVVDSPSVERRYFFEVPPEVEEPAVVAGPGTKKKERSKHVR